MNDRPKILIIYTGGTIGMIESIHTHTLEPFDFNHLMENVPKINLLDYDIENFQFDHPIDSSNMNPSHWDDMARVIEKNYERFDGFVVLHGTDTMAYTASALSFMLENLDKPVIITGSQLPIGEVRTDGEENLITALQIAAARDESGKSTIREVAILFENHLWRGNRAHKRSADNFNAFNSPNFPELAHIGLDIVFNRELLSIAPSPGEPLKVHYHLSTDVMVLFLFPGISHTVVKQALATPGVRGIVMNTYGAGNAPSEDWFLKELKEAIDRGVVVINVTQCPNGTVMQKLYATGEKLDSIGVLSGQDLTTEAALTKLMYLLGLDVPLDVVKRALTIPIRGEMTPLKQQKPASQSMRPINAPSGN